MSTHPRKPVRPARRPVRRNPLGGQRATVGNINHLVRSLERAYRYSTRIFHGEAILSVYDGPGGVYVVTGPRAAKMRSAFASNNVRLVKIAVGPVAFEKRATTGLTLSTILHPASVAYARMVGAALADGADPETAVGLFGKTVAAAWRRGAQRAILDAVVDDFACHPASGAEGTEIEPYIFGDRNALPEPVHEVLENFDWDELQRVKSALRRDIGDWFASEDFAKQMRRRMKAPDAFVGYRENPRHPSRRRSHR